MADFNTAFEYLIHNEDYNTNDPRYGKVHTDNDGGLVRFGINSKSLGKDLLNTTFFTSMSNDDAITVAMNLYNINNWQLMHGNEITSQRVASKIVDMSVDQGSTEAAKLTQRAVAVNVDGVIGPITITAINKENENIILKNLIYWNLWFIEQMISTHPEYKSYEAAWTTRAEKLPPAATGASS